MKKTKKPIFYRIYFTVIAVFVVLLIIGLSVLYVVLRNYENAQPETIANNFVADYIQEGKFLDIKNKYNLLVSNYETDDNIKSVLTEYTKGKKFTVAHSSIVPDDMDLAYVIKADGEKFMYIYLKKTNDKYEIKSTELAKDLYKQIKIEAYEGVSLQVNGIDVTKDHISDGKLPNLPKSIDESSLVKPIVASIDHLLTTDVKVKATGNGEEFNIKTSGTTYHVIQVLDSKTTKAVQNIAQKAAEAYAAYMQHDGSFGTLGQYCDSSTEFYKNASSSLTQFVVAHTGYKNENMELGDVYKYSDSLYSCRVKFTHMLYKGTTTHPDPFDKVVFVSKNKSGTYKVIDMQNVSEG